MIAIVTGASAGFGLAISKLLVKNKYKVIITARRKERLQKLQQELGKNSLVLAFDISNEKDTISAIENLPPKWQQIDLLVNNAGLALGLDPAYKCSLDDWKKMIATNITGLITITHKILPNMVARNKGHIINIGSVAGNYPYTGGNIYGATKAFIKQFSLNLRTDLIGTNVRVSNIEPGLCGGTEFSNVRFYRDQQKANDIYENVDYITADDIAQTVLWISQRPEHININRIEIMPIAQSPEGLKVYKNVKTTKK